MTPFPTPTRTIVPAMLLAALVATTGCAPRLSPLYRDFSDREEASTRQVDRDVARIDRALRAAGWKTKPGAVESAVATDFRPFREWGFYTVEVDLEVIPLAGEYVRVMINPYRRWFVGGRRKIPYLRLALAEDVMRDLAKAMESEGLVPVATVEERDREAGAR